MLHNYVRPNYTHSCCGNLGQLHFIISNFQYFTYYTSRGFTFILMVYKEVGDSVVSIATGYGLDVRGVGVRVPVGSKIFSSPRRPD
jgi:hypothetical protein